MMTIGAMSYFKQQSWQIPDDIAIISCNDFRWTEITDPALTVVSQPSTELGKLAANLLLNRISETSRGETQDNLCFSVPTKMILRDSC